MVQVALDNMVANQTEHMKRIAAKQMEQDKQLRILGNKIDDIRAGLDTFSVESAVRFGRRWCTVTGINDTCT